MATMPLEHLLTHWTPGSHGDDWTWDDEDYDLTLVDGDHQEQLTEDIRRNGITTPVLLGNDGRVWDGHHRIIAARRLHLTEIPVEEV